MATNIVNAVVEQANKVAAIDAKHPTIPVKTSVGQRALWWLAHPKSVNYLSVLASLWPRLLVGGNQAEALDKVLEFFGGFSDNLACIQFVRAYAVDRSPRPLKDRRRKAIKWLAAISPRDAVQMWSPALFDRPTKDDPGTLVQDVAELLSVCTKQSLDLPEIPTKLSPDVIKTLLESEMPQARLTAVRALQEMDLKAVDRSHAPLLNALRSDSSTIVAASARLAWRAFFGGKDVAASSSGGDSPPGELDE